MVSEPSQTLCVVIPIYQYVDRLEQLVRTIERYCLPIILVDDGSDAEGSATIAALASKNVAVVRHNVNRGKGAAITTGFRLALERGYQHAIQIDADGQHDSNDIPLFVAATRQHPYSLINSHPIFDSSMPKVRFYGRYLTHCLVWLHTLSLQIKDSMCGFRAYPLDLTMELIDGGQIGKRMDFDTEFIVRWKWHGHNICAIDTRVVYPEDGQSNFRLIRDNVLMTRMHVRLFFGMLVRFPGLLAMKWRNP